MTTEGIAPSPRIAARLEKQQAVRVAVRAEMTRRSWNISDLAYSAGVDPGTIGDFLDAVRWPHNKTLSKIEQAFEWPGGALARVYEGGEPPSVGGPDDDDGEADLLFRRPEDVSAEEWARIKQEARGFLEWQIDKAAKER